jgi:hypothetical protein
MLFPFRFGGRNDRVWTDGAGRRLARRRRCVFDGDVTRDVPSSALLCFGFGRQQARDVEAEHRLFQTGLVLQHRRAVAQELLLLRGEEFREIGGAAQNLGTLEEIPEPDVAAGTEQSA